MPSPPHRGLRRLAGVAAASSATLGLTLSLASGPARAGLVAAAPPASAAACSGTSGVTVVVDTGASISTRCASGDPSSALKALTAAGFSVTYPQQYPGSVVCRINGFPESDPCVRMPPADAYWAFFHARRGGSWTYSSNGVATYDPAAGTVVGFRFGSGQQPRVAPPEPTTTSAPVATTTTPKSTSAPRTSGSASASTSPPRSTSAGGGSSTSGSGGKASSAASPTTSASTSATPTASSSVTSEPPVTSPVSGAASVTPIAAAPTSGTDGRLPGAGTLLAGGALVALVAAGAGWTAWKRRT